ncbi:hypothetical protein [Polyangium jinanense]|uniref:Keratin associated protein n=1 Tax=Polyangium jinanense TaxID=2829994 RepID=A0A9X3WVU9_9BACT|nr:hypothetical protein [Polyangium jinanense]MDC3953740.1 hypothetical protein [Polyangium jinanense]MDC3979139.1 hypothetical protein [Polyangium jinanense]
MSQKNNWIRFAAAPAFVLGIGLTAGIGCSDVADIAEGCNEFRADAQWGANLDIDFRVKSFMSASGALVTLADQMIADVTVACEGIAKATKRDDSKWSSLEGAKRLEAVCAEAQLGFDEVMKANASVELVALVEGGKCEASLDAAAECNARCDVDAKCTPAQLEAKCEPGKLAGSCTAECRGSCTADVGATVECRGSCSAVCNGKCNGTCSSGDANNCNGRCDGTCEGTCSGSCELEANAAVECDGTCRGECSVDFEAPHCEGKITPPECELDADCQASCNAEIQAEASCTPPKVTIELKGGATADLEALVVALEEHLPKLIVTGIERGQAALDAGKVLVEVGGNLEGAITSSGKALVCATTAAAAALDASVEVQVSVEASASIGGKAAGSVN